jgi:capsular exopolysaccharide synthesis family protein
MDEPFTTVQVASAIAGEGKSTTAANLAVALARGGRRVALVDLDMRQPAVARAFGLSGPGVSDVARGTVELDDAMTMIPVGDQLTDGRLEVLPAGTAVTDPGEFVANAPIDDLLRELGERNDVVVVDAPPWVEAGDGAALSARVDAVLVVARLGVVRRAALSELRKALSASPARKLGVVLTGAEREEQTGGGYTYGDVRADDARLVGERGLTSTR